MARRALPLSEPERDLLLRYRSLAQTETIRVDGRTFEVEKPPADDLPETQQTIALAWSAAQVGKTLDVIVDGPDPEMPSQVQARGHADSPDIDCMVRVKGKNLRPGDLVRVKVTAADGYDLVARAVAPAR